jgi:hypothetical protein
MGGFFVNGKNDKNQEPSRMLGNGRPPKTEVETNVIFSQG